MLSAIICRVFFSLKIDRKCFNQTEFKRSMCSNMNKETERCFSKFQLAEKLKKKPIRQDNETSEKNPIRQDNETSE